MSEALYIARKAIAELALCHYDCMPKLVYELAYVNPYFTIKETTSNVIADIHVICALPDENPEGSAGYFLKMMSGYLIYVN